MNAVTGGDEETAIAPQPPELVRSFTDPEIGVDVRRPAGWIARRRKGAVEVLRRDKSVIVAVSSPAPASEVDGVLESALAALRTQYRDARVEERGDERRVAGRPAESAVVSARNAEGTRLRVLVSAVEGREEAYLVEVFAAEGAGSRRLAEAQAVLASLRLGK